MSKDLRRIKLKKRKILKTISLAGLAVVIGAAGIFAFAPIGASASEPPTTTTGLGLDPKNDPVVYTTESGLEIRMSNATKYSGTTTTTTNRGYSYTQDLTSFYYFTMGSFSGTIYTAASTTATYSVSNESVNWIILGLGKNTAYFLDEVAKNLFSTWKSNSGMAYSNGASGSYFFSEIYETYSPAGQLIDSVVSAKTYIMDKVKASIPIDPADEIPEGCMLVLSEKLLGQSYFNSKQPGVYSITNNWEDNSNTIVTGTGYYGNRYRYIGNSDTGSSGTSGQSWTTSNNIGGSLYNNINNLFSKNNLTGTIVSNNLGFTQSQANLIVPQHLYTFYSNGSTQYIESYATDSSTYYTLFPLACKSVTSKEQSFCLESYLNTNYRTATLIGSQQAYFWHTRSGVSSATNTFGPVRYTMVVGPSGDCYVSNVNNSQGVRPAMVMKLQ